MDQAQRSTLTWLAIAAGGAVVAYFVVKQLKGAGSDLLAKDAKEGGSTSGGGLVQWVGKAIGGETQFSETVKTQALPVAGAASSSVGGEVSARLVDPSNGGSVKRGLFADTVRLVFEVTNRTAQAWTGTFRLEVVEDYLVRDSAGSFSRIVTVEAGQALRLDVDYRLTGGVMLREPNLFLQIFLGSKHQGSATVEVS